MMWTVLAAVLVIVVYFLLDYLEGVYKQHRSNQIRKEVGLKTKPIWK